MAANILAGLGGSIGTGLGQGLESLAQSKMAQLHQRRQHSELSQKLQKLNIPANEADFIASQPAEVQQNYFKEIFSRGGFQQNQQQQGLPSEQQIGQLGQMLQGLSGQAQQKPNLMGALQQKTQGNPVLQQALAKAGINVPQQEQQQQQQQPQGQQYPGQQQFAQSLSPLSRPTLKEREDAQKQANLERKEENDETKDWAKSLTESRAAVGPVKRELEYIRKLLKDRSKLSHPLKGAAIKALGAKGYGIDLRSFLTKNSLALGSTWDKIITGLAATTGYRPSATLLDLVERAKGATSLTPEQNEELADSIDRELDRTVLDYNADKKIVKEFGYRPRDIVGRIAEMNDAQAQQENANSANTGTPNPQQAQVQPQPGSEDESWGQYGARNAARLGLRGAESIGDITTKALPGLLGQSFGPIANAAAPQIQQALQNLIPTSNPQGQLKEAIQQPQFQPQGILETGADKLVGNAAPLLISGMPVKEALTTAFGGTIGGLIGSAFGDLGEAAGTLAGMGLTSRIGSTPQKEFGKKSFAFSPETKKLEEKMTGAFNRSEKAASKIELPAKALFDELQELKSRIAPGLPTKDKDSANKLIDGLLERTRYGRSGSGAPTPIIKGDNIVKAIKEINAEMPRARGLMKSYLREFKDVLNKEIPKMESRSQEFKNTYSPAREIYKAFNKVAGNDVADKVDKAVDKIPLKHGWLKTLAYPIKKGLPIKTFKEGAKLVQLAKASPEAKKFLLKLAQAKLDNNIPAISTAIRNLDKIAGSQKEE